MPADNIATTKVIRQNSQAGTVAKNRPNNANINIAYTNILHIKRCRHEENYYYKEQKEFGELYEMFDLCKKAMQGTLYFTLSPSIGLFFCDRVFA